MALTTLFIPPKPCFSQLPQTWSNCWDSGSNVVDVECYWSHNPLCYPPNGATKTGTTTNTGRTATITEAYPSAISYSPGVLPPAFTTYSSFRQYPLSGDAGCLRSWTTNPDYGNYCVSTLTTSCWSSGTLWDGCTIAALLPYITVEWHESDLSLFMPASLPALPTASYAGLASILVSDSSFSYASYASSSGPTATLTATGTSKTISSASPHQTTSTSSHKQVGGLSTGAKAGIGVGVAVGVLLLLVIAFFIGRRAARPRIQERSEGLESVAEKRQTVHSRQPSVISAVELPHQGRSREELSGHEPYQLLNKEPQLLPNSEIRELDVKS